MRAINDRGSGGSALGGGRAGIFVGLIFVGVGVGCGRRARGGCFVFGACVGRHRRQCLRDGRRELFERGRISDTLAAVDPTPTQPVAGERLRRTRSHCRSPRPCVLLGVGRGLERGLDHQRRIWRILLGHEDRTGRHECSVHGGTGSERAQRRRLNFRVARWSIRVGSSIHEAWRGIPRRDGR